jgi:hypothetical protein
MTHETRSDAGAQSNLDLFPDLLQAAAAAPEPPRAARARGVGGRRARPAAGAGGGGYLNGRTTAELRQDVRLRELAEIGLTSTWLAVADLLGYDAFVGLWRLLSSDQNLRNDDNQIELRLRPFSAYERYQRNRYIDTLVASGIKPSQIHQMVRQQLGEKLSYRHIKRLAAAGRVKA